MIGVEGEANSFQLDINLILEHLNVSSLFFCLENLCPQRLFGQLKSLLQLPTISNLLVQISDASLQMLDYLPIVVKICVLLGRVCALFLNIDLLNLLWSEMALF